VSERGIPAREGRRLFGVDPDAYARARPDYPDRVFEVLERRCGLGAAAHVLEIGAGSGIATRRLARAGPARLVALEPDPRFGRALREIRHSIGSPTRLEIRFEAFEDAEFAPAEFDLVTAATSFHWVEQRTGLAKTAEILRANGWLALFWNVFGDPERDDPFHEATQPWLSGLSPSPSQAGGPSIPFALDIRARRSDLAASHREVDVERIAWTLELDADGVRALYATFSSIAVLAERRRDALLDRLASIARDEFGGRVQRNVVTVLYTAQRRP